VLEQEKLGVAAPGSPQAEARGDDARVVHDHERALRKRVRELVEEPVPDGAGRSVVHE
jgi:hypothetical protein